MLDALRGGEPFPQNKFRQVFDIGEDYSYLNELKTLKIIKSDSYGDFKPKEYITTEEAMLSAYKMIKLL